MFDGNPNKSLQDALQQLEKLSTTLTETVAPNAKKAAAQFEVEDKTRIGDMEVVLNKAGIVMVSGCNKETYNKIVELLRND